MPMMQRSYSDLGYCKGTHAEVKKALFQEATSKGQIKNPKGSKGLRMSKHQSDIKERMDQLERAMTKTKFVTSLDVDRKLGKADPGYGTPAEGTKTAERGKRAHTHVHREILELCELIYSHGYEDPDEGIVVMLFGDLFRIYTRISDKVVGILLRAKKYGLVYFEPEILFQGQDDETPVFLLKPMKDIYSIYNINKSFSLPN